ncbi:MAG: hypothetical protein ACRERU_12550 [Methylococcales bacterium]
MTIDGEILPLEALLAAWDEDLPELIGHTTTLASTWREFRAVRGALLPHLGILVYQARPWLDGCPEMLGNIRRYLELASHLYREVQENYLVMASDAHDWAL